MAQRRWAAPVLAAASAQFSSCRLAANGKWTETVRHSFNGKDGAHPYAGVIFDAAGNLYGTTFSAATGKSTVFRLTPSANGKWTHTVLHPFSGKDGRSLYAGLIFDAEGKSVRRNGGRWCIQRRHRLHALTGSEQQVDSHGAACLPWRRRGPSLCWLGLRRRMEFVRDNIRGRQLKVRHRLRHRFPAVTASKRQVERNRAVFL
jgi:hypothetical protein